MIQKFTVSREATNDKTFPVKVKSKISEPCSNIVKTIQLLYTEIDTAISEQAWHKAKPAFDRLRHYIADVDAPTAQAVLATPEIQALRPALLALREVYEYTLEKQWAEHIIAHAQPHMALRALSVYAGYYRAVHFEISLLEKALPQACQSILFIGPGPLPLTVILLAQHFACPIVSVDIRSEACTLAADVCKALGLAHLTSFHCADVRAFTNFAQYDTIFLAALVGADDVMKKRIVQHLSQHIGPAQVLMLRKGHLLRQLVYATIAVEDLTAFEVNAFQASPKGVFQSTLVARKRG